MSERVLFVSSNGTGLGHLTRSMAIARRLEGLEPLFLTLSGAAPVVRDQGFAVEYVASYATPGAGSDWRWSRRLRGRLSQAFAEADPAAIVFDGAHPYQALIDALPRARAARRIWCRRPLWRPGANRGAIGRERFFDAVLEPGELAAAEDRGATVARRANAHVVDPIVFCEDSELLERADAARELGLDPDATTVLVNLGQGAEVRDLAERAVSHLAGRPGVQVGVLSSAIAAGLEVSGEVVHLRATYPISRYYKAIDACVAAAGYNAYHELIRFCVPSVFVPMRRQTDDQAARARVAARQGLGLDGSDPDRIEELAGRLLDADERRAMAARLRQRRPPNGAAEAARWLEELVTGPTPQRVSRGRWRRYLRRPLHSARQAAPFVARMPLHAAALAKQTVERRPPRALVLAIGLERSEFEAAVTSAVRGLPDPPHRVLVVTDLLELAALRRLGVGFDHIPARGDPEAELAGVPYEEFARARLRLILAERPRPRRVVALGSLGQRLAGQPVP